MCSHLLFWSEFLFRLLPALVHYLLNGGLQLVDLNRLGDVGVHAGVDGVPHVAPTR